MKTLLLLRHAKSSWKDAGLADHDRPLNKRGKQSAEQMGEVLLREQLLPDLIVSSTAKRARKTAARVAKNSGYDGSIELFRDLYFGPLERWITFLRELSDEVARVMLVGHNPGLEEFLHLLTGQQEVLATAALVQITFAIDNWRDLSAGGGALAGIWRPREEM